MLGVGIRILGAWKKRRKNNGGRERRRCTWTHMCMSVCVEGKNPAGKNNESQMLFLP